VKIVKDKGEDITFLSLSLLSISLSLSSTVHFLYGVEHHQEPSQKGARYQRNEGKGEERGRRSNGAKSAPKSVTVFFSPCFFPSLF
jgi:hypothetical protein